MSNSDALPTIFSQDFIMAYGDHSKFYVQPEKKTRSCSCHCWCQYSLFVLNVLIWAAGGALIGFGAWLHVNSAELELFKELLTVPSWLLVGTGIMMTFPGLFGCAGSLRLNIYCLRTFMVLLVAVLVLQISMGAVLFFRMDELEHTMLAITKTSVINYQIDVDFERDKALDYLQHRFTCCGGWSFLDWESNKRYNCSNVFWPTSCGVPVSCCRGTQDEQCGYGVRAGTKEYSDMFAYTEGCVVALMNIFRENMMVIAVLAFSVCFLELNGTGTRNNNDVANDAVGGDDRICCLVLSCIICKHIVCKKSSLTPDNHENMRKFNSKFTPTHTHHYYR